MSGENVNAGPVSDDRDESRVVRLEDALTGASTQVGPADIAARTGAQPAQVQPGVQTQGGQQLQPAPAVGVVGADDILSRLEAGGIGAPVGTAQVAAPGGSGTQTTDQERRLQGEVDRLTSTVQKLTDAAFIGNAAMSDPGMMNQIGSGMAQQAGQGTGGFPDIKRVNQEAGLPAGFEPDYSDFGDPGSESYRWMMAAMQVNAKDSTRSVLIEYNKEREFVEVLTQDKAKFMQRPGRTEETYKDVTDWMQNLDNFALEKCYTYYLLDSGKLIPMLQEGIRRGIALDAVPPGTVAQSAGFGSAEVTTHANDAMGIRKAVGDAAALNRAGTNLDFLK